MMWSDLRPRQPCDRVAQRAGAGVEADLRKLGCRLGREAKDGPAGGAIGPGAVGWRGSIRALVSCRGGWGSRRGGRGAFRAAALRPPMRERAEDV